MHRAQDGHAAAASVAVGERAVARGVIIRRSACCANCGPLAGPERQGSPLALIGLCLKADLIPFALRRQFQRHSDGRLAGADIACCAAAAARAYTLTADITVVVILIVPPT